MSLEPGMGLSPTGRVSGLFFVHITALGISTLLMLLTWAVPGSVLLAFADVFLMVSFQTPVFPDLLMSHFVPFWLRLSSLSIPGHFYLFPAILSAPLCSRPIFCSHRSLPCSSRFLSPLIVPMLSAPSGREYSI